VCTRFAFAIAQCKSGAHLQFPLNATLAAIMNTEESTYYINGDEPPIVGDRCQSLYLLQYQEFTQITDQANVLYLQFSNNWYRLYFDGGTIFWRESDKPEEPINNNLESVTVLINLNGWTDYIGETLKKISYSGNTSEISTELVFGKDKSIKLIHNGYKDTTSIKSIKC